MKFDLRVGGWRRNSRLEGRDAIQEGDVFQLDVVAVADRADVDTAAVSRLVSVLSPAKKAMVSASTR
jgi:hypothetical protein